MQLSDLAEVQMGYAFRSRLEHDPQGDVAVIQMKDIDDEHLLHAQEALRITLPRGKTHHLLQAGDLLFRSRGRSNGAALVGAGIGPAVLAAPMLLIRPQRVLPAYLGWYLNAPTTQNQLTAMAEGTSVRMISAEALKALEIPVPPPELQQHIVQVADLAAREQHLIFRIAAARQRLTTHHLMQLACHTPERAAP
jgi:hypothetical protein